MVERACVILCLYVDDIPIFGTRMKIINETKPFLSNNFNMKDLGPTNVILEAKLIKGDNEFLLTQSHYVKHLLERFGYCELSPISTFFLSIFEFEK